MLEWLAASTGIELGKLVLEHVLDVSKPVLEGYVQDFFKDCLGSGVARLNAATLKTPMAEAVGYFIKRFVRELQINEVPDTSIEHHYKAALQRFVKDKAVGTVLGKAFEKGCKQIDYAELERVWVERYQVAGWQFPAEEFDWRGVGKEYVYEVRGIIKANAELRALLETELLEEIAQNTAQISPGFDLETYRESLQSSYGYLKLYTLDSTDRVDAIKLWAIFIEQTVREALPPLRYELPLDLKRRLQDEGQLEDDLSPETLEDYRREYFQQPARKVLEVVADSQRAVILGDPGSGKSSLLQYLALEWVEGKTETLPLLIELREFAIDPAANFLDFLHRGRGVDWQFDQQELHQHLLESSTLVMFDGLDEVFDRTLQSTVVDDIIRFSQQYPKAQVLVTSRIIGYSPERLQHSGFRHFTIQSLDTDEIHEFIDRWYDLSMRGDPDKGRLKQRLRDAIANSQAIANLADNPLLLTMMAILNRRQELPRDRADLYDQASRVLLYHWDVDHKRLKLPMDAIGRREKQEMLRAIAYEMQAGDEGLKGNLISAERLVRVLTDYLRDQGFSESREKANRLIQQLRERNFILCYRGADTYGFVHRTFLEYFCAVEIVHRFEKQRSLTFEQLRDEVFGQNWQDETWHEVLRLICGRIDVKFTGKLIDFLIKQEIDIETHMEKRGMLKIGDYRLDKKGLSNLIIASECLLEIKYPTSIANYSNQLLNIWKDEIKSEISSSYYFSSDDSDFIVELIAKIWCREEGVLEFFKKVSQESTSSLLYSIISVIAKYWHHKPDVLKWLKSYAKKPDTENDLPKGQAIESIAEYWGGEKAIYIWIKKLLISESRQLRAGAIRAIAKAWTHNPETLEIIKKYAKKDSQWNVRGTAIRAFSQYYSQEDDFIEFLSEVAVNDPFTRESFGDESWRYFNPRSTALEELSEKHPKHLKIFTLFIDRAEHDPDPIVRNRTAIILSENWMHMPNMLDFLSQLIVKELVKRGDWMEWNPIENILKQFIKQYPHHPKTLELLRDRASKDLDKELRDFAQKQLEMIEK